MLVTVSQSDCVELYCVKSVSSCIMSSQIVSIFKLLNNFYCGISINIICPKEENRKFDYVCNFVGVLHKKFINS